MIWSRDCDEPLWCVENKALGLMVPTSRHMSPLKSATLPEKDTPARMDDSYKLVISVDMVRARLSELWLENLVEGCVE
jgi:hypothetical protein